jgi:hypothetical protein
VPDAVFSKRLHKLALTAAKDGYKLSNKQGGNVYNRGIKAKKGV